MENGCDHGEGSIIGKCAICEKMVCGECYRSIFSEIICDGHRALEDESEWELVGYYSSGTSLTERRYALEEHGIASLAVESDEESVELYVPMEEKDDAYASLAATGDDSALCVGCKIQFSSDLEMCPICGVKPATGEGEPN